MARTVADPNNAGLKYHGRNAGDADTVGDEDRKLEKVKPLKVMAKKPSRRLRKQAGHAAKRGLISPKAMKKFGGEY